MKVAPRSVSAHIGALSARPIARLDGRRHKQAMALLTSERGAGGKRRVSAASAAAGAAAATTTMIPLRRPREQSCFSCHGSCRCKG